MHYSTLLLALTTLVTSTSAHQPKLQRAHPETIVKRNNDYKLLEKHQGESFFKNYDFFTYPDPTHGSVMFVSSSDLAYVKCGVAVMKVDNSAHLKRGEPRRSIRISSKRKINKGLVIADIEAAPYGCTLWPAFWMVGPNWPYTGEIDIFEGVNLQNHNQLSVHTGAGCSFDSNPSTSPLGGKLRGKAYSGNVVATQCVSTNTSNVGCNFQDPSDTSFGRGFNEQGGLIFATLINDHGIAVWRFPRNNVPGDIEDSAPDPSKWGTPVAFWSSRNCPMKEHFVDLSTVFDVTICGDWAGSAGVYKHSSCPGTCQDLVTNPRNFDNAYWAVRYVAIYSAP